MSAQVQQSGADRKQTWDVVDGRTGVRWGNNLARSEADKLAKQLGPWTSVEPHIDNGACNQ